MKKAELHAQVFLYLLGLFIISLVVIYGYNAMKMFKEKAEQVEYIQFKSDILASIETISSDYGSVKKETFTVPAKYDTVCFIDLTRPPPSPPDNIPYLLVENSWNEGILANIFLIKGQTIEPLFAGDPDTKKSFIQIADPGYICIPTANNKLKIRLEGKGSHAVVSLQ